MFNSKKESLDSKYNRTQSNGRYSHFKQLHFTVGDEDQFDKEISEMDLEMQKKCGEKDKLNIFNYLSFDFWEGYKFQEKINVIQTFRYIFYKFKKGIFIQLKNNKVQKFLPLSNANFVNEWAGQISVDYNDFKKVSALENRPYNEKNINKFIQNWFCNNCLLRYEYPVNESDTNVSNIKSFFEELCQLRKVPDMIFFVNKRDFPLLTKNSTEPYYDIWGYNKPLISHHYDSYLPILSMSKTDDYADILIPTHEDWARVKQKESKWFTDSRVSDNDDNDEEIDFMNKKPIAVFRGSSTGEGFTIETNQRLKIAYLSSLNKKDKDNIPYLDCGITKWNTRVKKIHNSSKIQMIDPETLPFSLVDYMPISQQQSYKYIVHIDGHVSAFRLSAMLKLNSVILIVASKWKMWYSDLLVPYEHYIPIKSDLSDLYSQIEWCKENDDLCEYVAANARDFSEKYLEKDGILDFTQKMLFDLKQFMTCVRAPPVAIVRQENQPKTLPDDIQKAIEEEEKDIIFENRNVTILKCKETPVVIKKRKQQNHNISGLFWSDLPNLCKIYGRDCDQNMVMEYIDGVKLYDFIASEKLFNFKIYLDVFVQICLSLHVSQKETLFVHNDLTPWNIILKYYPDVQDIKYDNNIYQISTKVVPIIIDFDKSHVVDSENIHRGSVNEFKFSSVHDILTFLFTSLYQIISNHRLSHSELSSVIKLANFISNTKFYPHSFRSIHQLKGFLYSMKKHSSLMYTDKMDLENLTPLDFIFYLKKTNVYNSITIFPKKKPNENNNDQFVKELLKQKNEFEFDKYTFWSASKSLKIHQKIQGLDQTKFKFICKNLEKYDSIILKKIISDIQTFNSIYK